ncbi:helix-turn-helix domain-containing protein [Limosilactobacillus mucosae]|uniref:helix-turn-helix domain-containing protein n=1 Tax=Limosilactobacillus mucosae TaxID=97478 RepID=UPI003EBE956D
MNDEQFERPSYYSIIPATVRYDKRLKAYERLMFSEITALSNKYGYCTASNSYFASLYEVDKTTISRWINHLKNLGYLQTQMIKNGRAVASRRIYPNMDPVGRPCNTPIDRNATPIDQKINTLLIKGSRGYTQKDQYPIDRIAKENNTRVNNTRVNNTSIINSNYATNSEYIHSDTNASSLATDDDVRRTQSGQALAQSVATAAPAQLQQPAVQPQHQSQASNWTEPADPSGPDSLADPNGMNPIFKIWGDLWSWPSSTTIADLTAWVKEFGSEVVLYAIKKAATADASRPHAYVAAIMRGYRNAGIKNLDDVKAAEQARDQRNQQSYGRQQYGRGGGRANAQEQLPDWAKQDDDDEGQTKTIEQLNYERSERELHRAVLLHRKLYNVDLERICHSLDQPDGHGYLSAKAPKLFEQYCEQNNLDVVEQIKKARKTADFDSSI